MFGWVRVTIAGTTYSHIKQTQKMSCGPTCMAMLVWNCGYGFGSEIAAKWTVRGDRRERLGRDIFGDTDPLDDRGTKLTYMASLLEDYYGVRASAINTAHFTRLMNNNPHDWSSFIVAAIWNRGGGHAILVIVRGTDALVFDPGKTAGTISVVPAANLVQAVPGGQSLNVPGLAAHKLQGAVHVPPQRSGAAIFKNILQTPSWLWDFGRKGMPGS